MIVVDASAALAALLNDGQARQLIAAERLHVPHLVDSEIASGLRRLAQRDRLGAADGRRALQTWRRLAVTRYPVVGFSSVSGKSARTCRHTTPAMWPWRKP